MTSEDDALQATTNISNQLTLDMDKVQELHELMGDKMSILVDSYINSSTETLDKLQRATGAMDGDEIRQLAHGLKGSSGNLGAVQVVDLSDKIEQLARQEQLEGVSQIVDELLNAFESVKKKLNEVVSG